MAGEIIVVDYVFSSRSFASLVVFLASACGRSGSGGSHFCNFGGCLTIFLHTVLCLYYYFKVDSMYSMYLSIHQTHVNIVQNGVTRFDVSIVREGIVQSKSKSRSSTKPFSITLWLCHILFYAVIVLRYVRNSP